MSANLIVGILWTLAGVFAVLSHRKIARQNAAFYQKSPENKVKFFEWCSLLGGAALIIAGIPMLADSRTRLGGFLFLPIGLASIFLSDWQARCNVRWQQSEKYQRSVMLTTGIMAMVMGALCLLHIIVLGR